MKQDKLENLKLYKEIPSEAIKFIASGVFPCGRYVLSDKVYVNIEEYDSKYIKDARFESHKNYIDVQIVLEGAEELYYTDIKGLTVEVPYSEDRDIMFYKDDVSSSDNILLDGSNFIILSPDDAHAPQVCVNNQPQKVKKMVIKIKV